MPRFQVPGRVLPYKKLMGMCRWMGSHFHDLIDYNGVAFSIELLEYIIFTVSKRTRMFNLYCR